jgi:hypothetical protein
MIKTKRQDATITCVECTEPFTWTSGEQVFYEEKGFDPPKRCPGCRKKRKLDQR